MTLFFFATSQLFAICSFLLLMKRSQSSLTISNISKISNSARILSSSPSNEVHPVEIDYARKYHLNKTLLDQVDCIQPPTCNEPLLFGKFNVRHGDAVIDVKRKILMEFTPKAGCTYAVSMFLQHLGYHYNVHYNIWPHTFRIGYFYPKCGRATACMYSDPSWYRFKIVRNPYDRAVSSFLYISNNPQYGRDMVKAEQLQELSFRSYIQLLSSYPPQKMERLSGDHAAYQASEYERYVYYENKKANTKTIKLFNRIVKLENIQEDIDKYINPETGFHFELSYKGDHLAPRHNETHYFVGDVPWRELKVNIPEDYGLFYDESIKDMVTKIYLWDLEIYNYTFPFHLPH